MCREDGGENLNLSESLAARSLPSRGPFQKFILTPGGSGM